MKEKLWTREETIVAFYVYCTIPFASSSKQNPTVIYYAKLLGRTPSALNMKIGNLGRLDPELQKQNITGLTHGAKMEEIVWEEFSENREELVYEAEKIIASLMKKPVGDRYLEKAERDYASEDKRRLVKTRINQSFFRASVLAAYEHTCAITGVELGDFLIASHIKPWAADKANRLNPHNGICLNVLHDKAFDKGYITVDKKYRLIVSRKLKECYTNDFFERAFQRYAGHRIFIPKKFAPSMEFLTYHQDMIFRGE